MIGVFDSGLGGLTVAREIKRVLPNRRLIYFGDTARYPWGNKSPEVIRQYAKSITIFLKRGGAREIVIACNTASAFAGDYLRREFPQIKFRDVINPVAERIRREAKKKKGLRLGIIGTRGTIGSRAYEKAIGLKNGRESKIKILSKACPLLVPLAEEGWGNKRGANLIVEEYLKDLRKKRLDYLVLGCTHYPLLSGTLKKVLPVPQISSAKEVARVLSRESEGSAKKDRGQDVFYFSDITEQYQNLASKIMGKDLRLQKMVLKD